MFFPGTIQDPELFTHRARQRQSTQFRMLAGDWIIEKHHQAIPRTMINRATVLGDQTPHVLVIGL